MGQLNEHRHQLTCYPFDSICYNKTSQSEIAKMITFDSGNIIQGHKVVNVVHLPFIGARIYDFKTKKLLC